MPLFGKTVHPTSGESFEPEAANDRLAHTAGADPAGMFTSDLSVSEYALLGEAGFEPLGFVLGSSIYHIGLQVARWDRNQELQVLTQAMYEARELAMTRMESEATQLGADGVVGVDLRFQAYVWGQDVLEFIATGTAVRSLTPGGGHRCPDGRPFSSDLSAQDFFRLLATGSVPVAFVLGTCVYHIAHQSALQSMRQSVQNQEMTTFTQESTRPVSSLSQGCRPRRPGQRRRVSWVSQLLYTTTSGESMRPSSSPPGLRSGASEPSTAWPIRRRSPPLPSASTPSQPEPVRAATRPDPARELRHEPSTGWSRATEKLRSRGTSMAKIKSIKLSTRSISPRTPS